MQEDLDLTDTQVNLITSFGLLGLFFTFFAGFLSFFFFSFFLFFFLFSFFFSFSFSPIFPLNRSLV